MEKTLGGDRLGSGKRQKVYLHGYERSNHDRSYLFRTTASAGTLIPFIKQVAMPGTTMDIDLNAVVMTHPTVGPLFGSMKVQLDVFQCPMRLYQGQLHNNKLGIGMKMSNVKLPLVRLQAFEIPSDPFPDDVDFDNYQINPSCILSYLGIRGVGVANTGGIEVREFNAIPWIAYWDIYKNYYANKQEEIGAVIHSAPGTPITNVSGILINGAALAAFPAVGTLLLGQEARIHIDLLAATPQPLNQIGIMTNQGVIWASEAGNVIYQAGTVIELIYDQAKWGTRTATYWYYRPSYNIPTDGVEVQTFDLNSIDQLREAILAHSVNSTPFDLNDSAGAPDTALQPYNFILDGADGAPFTYQQSQEGLGLKTYNSDLFNNWLSTEWIDGPGGINELSRIDVSGGYLEIDSLLIGRKVYDMLNRIMVSGGSFQDWVESMYDHKGFWAAESPMYQGGLIKELIFQEVISNSESGATNNGVQPLGTLGGRGTLSSKHKGGKITIRVDEPSYIMGIFTITPRVDYSQGNDWDIHIKTMDDWHKPAMDEIGFQELLIEQMAWWSTYWDTVSDEWVTRSVGKQPAWINYMTNVNKTYGNFAIDNNEMFMTLNRRYRAADAGGHLDIDDLTTYIDPAKYNNIFAQTSRDSQNFWVQISVDIFSRQKQSQKVMPNL